MTLKYTATSTIVGVFGLGVFGLMYPFFRSALNFWFSEIFANIAAMLPAPGAAYLMAYGLARSKMNTLHKILTAIVILATIAALVLTLIAMSVALSRVFLMIGE